MCNDNDLDGVRLWFYGGTPPLDDLDTDAHETYGAPGCEWAWPLPKQHTEPAAASHEPAIA